MEKQAENVDLGLVLMEPAHPAIGAVIPELPDWAFQKAVPEPKDPPHVEEK